jgi:hypothetical protein
VVVPVLSSFEQETNKAKAIVTNAILFFIFLFFYQSLYF